MRTRFYCIYYELLCLFKHIIAIAISRPGLLGSEQQIVYKVLRSLNKWMNERNATQRTKNRFCAGENCIASTQLNLMHIKLYVAHEFDMKLVCGVKFEIPQLNELLFWVNVMCESVWCGVRGAVVISVFGSKYLDLFCFVLCCVVSISHIFMGAIRCRIYVNALHELVHGS